MNTQLSATLSAGLLLSFATLSSSAPAYELHHDLAAGVGRWIAVQGNAAVREIEKDLQQHLRQTLKPFVPPPATSTPEAPAGDKAAP